MWGGGWAWLFSKVICWCIKLKPIRIPSAGVGGLCVSIFSSFARLAFVCQLCMPCKCVKNSVVSCRQSHGCLNVCRMSFRVTYNVGACCCVGILYCPAWQLKPNKKQNMKLTTNVQKSYICRILADRSGEVDCYSVSKHSSKPLVVGSFMSYTALIFPSLISCINFFFSANDIPSIIFAIFSFMALKNETLSNVFTSLVVVIF